MTTECNKSYLYRNPRHSPRQQKLWLDLSPWQSSPFGSVAKNNVAVMHLLPLGHLGVLGSLLLTTGPATETNVSILKYLESSSQASSNHPQSCG